MTPGGPVLDSSPPQSVGNAHDGSERPDNPKPLRLVNDLYWGVRSLAAAAGFENVQDLGCRRRDDLLYTGGVWSQSGRPAQAKGLGRRRAGRPAPPRGPMASPRDVMMEQ